MNKPDAAKSPKGAAMEARLIQDLPTTIKQILTHYRETIATLRADVARLEAHFNAGQEWERRDCEKALVALAGVHICTPAETYGVNTSWAISDLCRGVTMLAAELSRERERHQEFREMSAEMSMVIQSFRDAGIDHRYCLPPDDFCHICIRAREAEREYYALLEPKPQPAPVDTGGTTATEQTHSPHSAK